MNKGLELIEAAQLFPVDVERLDVIVHPQSVIHSMVEYVDGSVLAQLGSPDMRIPIAYAMGWPERIATPAARLDLAAIANLSFEKPDLNVFLPRAGMGGYACRWQCTVHPERGQRNCCCGVHRRASRVP